MKTVDVHILELFPSSLADCILVDSSMVIYWSSPLLFFGVGSISILFMYFYF